MVDQQERQPSDYELAVLKEMFTGRRGRFRAYLFELAVAAGYVLIAIAWLMDPKGTSHTSAVGTPDYPFDYIWSVLYLVGGTGVIYGVLRPALRVRAAGLILLGTALVMQSVAVASFHIDARIGFYVIMATACFMRALLIWRVFRAYQGYAERAAAATA